MSSIGGLLLVVLTQAPQAKETRPSKPEMTRPETTRPETTRPDTTKPDTKQPAKTESGKGPLEKSEAEARATEGPPLSELARQLLRRRMERHGKDMTQLMTGVVLLKREVVRTLAAGISSEPRIVRPLPDAKDELNASLPERFFVLQDELRERAKNVAERAQKGSDKELGESFALLTQTCVACHSAFLKKTDDR
jgi:hypothetical protein